MALKAKPIPGIVTGEKHQLDWIIDADEQITEQTLEISTDGRNFTPVTQLSGKVRSFNYKPYPTATAQYRLNVSFDNGHQYYSNIIILKQATSSARPHLVSNFIYNSISVNSPGNYSYTIYDFNGKTINEGQLKNGMNTIVTGSITKGMYMIRFANSADQSTDKFMKQ